MKELIIKLAAEYPCHLQKVVAHRHPDVFAVVEAVEGDTFAQKAYNYVHDDRQANHVCICGSTLGFVKYPVGYRKYCSVKCDAQHRKLTQTIPQQQAKLKTLDIELLSQPTADEWSNKSKYKFRNLTCGHEFEARFDNVINGRTTCATCGPTKRAAVALEGFIAKYARTEWDMARYKDYRTLVNKLTRQTYRQHTDAINPTHLPLGRAGTEGAHHIDHIVPVIVCFAEDIPAHICASLPNLTVLPWEENLSKHDNLTEHAEKLLAEWKNLISVA